VQQTWQPAAAAAALQDQQAAAAQHPHCLHDLLIVTALRHVQATPRMPFKG
jgi:hypothetical protein